MKILHKIKRFKTYIVGVLFMLLGSLPSNSVETYPTPLARRNEQNIPHRLAGNKGAQAPRSNLSPWSEPIKDTRARLEKVKNIIN